MLLRVGAGFITPLPSKACHREDTIKDNHQFHRKTCHKSTAIFSLAAKLPGRLLEALERTMKVTHVFVQGGNAVDTFIGHFTRNDIAQQLRACVGCQECLVACPAITAPLSVNDLNAQTYGGEITLEVARFGRACTQCGACVSVCPVGLRRDAMMLWLKVRLSKTTLKDVTRKTSLRQWMHIGA
jgi:ferredoxin